MTDLRTAAEMALNALEFSLPAIEDFGSKEQLTDCHRAIMALYKSIAQPEQEPFKPDWVSYRQGVVDGAAQPEQEEPLPLVDIGVDVTPEGTHVVACYNRPDAVQEMFYSQFHPLTKPEQEAVCDKDPFYCWSIRCQVGKVCKHAQLEQAPQLTDAGADTNIVRGLVPKGAGMVTLHQPVAWMDSEGRFSYFKGSDEDAPLYSAPPNLAQPEQFVVSFPSFMRKRIEQALKDAIHPTGMSVHDGKVKVLVSDLHRMLLVIDSAPPKREWVCKNCGEQNVD